MQKSQILAPLAFTITLLLAPRLHFLFEGIDDVSTLRFHSFARDGLQPKAVACVRQQTNTRGLVPQSFM